MTVTALEPQKRNPGRRSVFVDGAYFFGLDEETCVTLGLAVGNHYSLQELERIREQGEFYDAKQYGLRLIARRSYSVYLVKQKLENRGYQPEVIQKTVDYLCQLGYLDDEAYARCFAHDAAVLNKKGKRLIMKELCARGIDRDTAEAAWESLEDKCDLGNNLKKIIQKRLTDPNDRKAVRHVFDYCIRRGYAYEEVSQTMKRYIEEENNE